ncbi:MAG TPA: transposase [Dehalococcoidia bacterium]|nr:transposase [Dehalococcoidia bacterium]
MSVYRRFTGHDVPSLITTNIAGHKPLFADPSAANALILAMEHAEAELWVTVYAYVVMPDHLHLVVAPNENTTHGDFVRLLKGRFAHRWNRNHGRDGSIWQSRFHERALRNERALLAAIDYVHSNPVAAGLAERPEDYAWSSIREYLPKRAAQAVRLSRPRGPAAVRVKTAERG